MVKNNCVFWRQPISKFLLCFLFLTCQSGYLQRVNAKKRAQFNKPFTASLQQHLQQTTYQSSRKFSVSPANATVYLHIIDKQAIQIRDTRTDRLIQTVYPPVAAKYNDWWQSAAFSASSHLLAIAGWFGLPGSLDTSICIYSSQTGKLLTTITGFPVNAASMALSLRGDYLYIGLASGHGLRIVNLETGLTEWQDRHYLSGIQVIAATAKKIYTISENNALRSYDLQNKKIYRTFLHSKHKAKSLYVEKNKIYTNFYNSTKQEIWQETGTHFFSTPLQFYKTLEQNRYDKKQSPKRATPETELLLSPQAKRIVFQRNGVRNVAFSIVDRQYITSPPEIDGLHAAKRSAETFSINYRQNDSQPSWDERTLPLERGEKSTALCIDRQERYFLLATNRYLRKFSHIGKEIWKVKSSSTLLAINTSLDGSTIVLQTADKKIHWMRSKDGAFLFSLALLGTKNWILYSPLGFYDTNNTNQKQLGWLVNDSAGKEPIFVSAYYLRKALWKTKLFPVLLQQQKTDREILQQKKIKSSILKKRILRIAQKKRAYQKHNRRTK